MPTTLPICVRFDYFMASFGVGRLTMYGSSMEGEDRVFDKTGQQGNDWTSAQKTLDEFRDGSKVHSHFIKRSTISGLAIAEIYYRCVKTPSKAIL